MRKAVFYRCHLWHKFLCPSSSAFLGGIHLIWCLLPSPSLAVRCLPVGPRDGTFSCMPPAGGPALSWNAQWSVETEGKWEKQILYFSPKDGNHVWVLPFFSSQSHAERCYIASCSRYNISSKFPTNQKFDKFVFFSQIVTTQKAMCSGFLLRSPSGSVYLSLGSTSACPRVSPSLGGNYTFYSRP